jgi:hypothetical protein
MEPRDHPGLWLPTRSSLTRAGSLRETERSVIRKNGRSKRNPWKESQVSADNNEGFSHERHPLAYDSTVGETSPQLGPVQETQVLGLAAEHIFVSDMVVSHEPPTPQVTVVWQPRDKRQS